MAVYETRWTPSRGSVAKKNTKCELADAIIRIWDYIQTDRIKEEKVKHDILKILMLVL